MSYLVLGFLRQFSRHIHNDQCEDLEWCWWEKLFDVGKLLLGLQPSPRIVELSSLYQRFIVNVNQWSMKIMDTPGWTFSLYRNHIQWVCRDNRQDFTFYAISSSFCKIMFAESLWYSYSYRLKARSRKKWTARLLFLVKLQRNSDNLSRKIRKKRWGKINVCFLLFNYFKTNLLCGFMCPVI